VNVGIIYKATLSAFSLSHQFEVPLHESAQTSHFAPVFFTKDSFFEKLLFTEQDAACFEAIYWVANFQQIRLPVEFTATR
jgi:hypothetical protein